MADRANWSRKGRIRLLKPQGARQVPALAWTFQHSLPRAKRFAKAASGRQPAEQIKALASSQAAFAAGRSEYLRPGASDWRRYLHHHVVLRRNRRRSETVRSRGSA